MDIQSVLAHIPFLESYRLEVSVEQDGAVRARLPFHRQLTNHVGTLHAAAIYTVAETAAGVAASQIIPDDRAVVLLRGATIHYTRRAQADLAATARVAEGQGKVALAAFEQSERADVQVEVTVCDPDREKVFEGSFDYALRPRRS